MTEVAYGSLPFREQIAFLLGKVNVPTHSWIDVWHDEHDVGFMVAGAYKAQLLQDLRAAVQDEIIAGTPLEQFKKDFVAIADKHGWSYHGTPAWRARVIYETNLSTSYAAGRYAQLTDPDLLSVRPYWVYHHMPGELHPRPEHVALDGLAVHADSPWWNSWYPPNGWGCQCWVTAESDDSLARKKIIPSQPPPIDYQTKIVGQLSPSGPRVVRVPKGIDPGFNYAPGATRAQRIRDQLSESADRLPPELALLLKQDLKSDPPPAPPAPEVATSRAAPRTLDEHISEGKTLLDRFVPDRANISLETIEHFQARVLDELGTTRTLDAKLSIKSRGEAAHRVSRVARRLPTDWIEASNRAGPLTARMVTKRSSYQHGGGNSGIFRISRRSGDEVALHELMHRIQYVHPELDKLFQELHKRRTASEARIRIYSGEYGRRDRYVTAYQGKEYRFGNDNGNALEVITMAFQYVLGGRKSELAAILEKDPEMVQLVLSTLWYF